MPLCTNCGSHDVEQIDDDEFACLNCDAIFIYDGMGLEELEVSFPKGDSLDMQMFDDRISCLGDD
jgi:hypothetical protein